MEEKKSKRQRVEERERLRDLETERGVCSKLAIIKIWALQVFLLLNAE